MSSKIIERVHDKNGFLTFYKKENGYWVRQTFKGGLRVYYEDSEGLCVTKRFNRDGQLTYEKETQHGIIKREEKFINYN